MRSKYSLSQKQEKIINEYFYNKSTPFRPIRLEIDNQQFLSKTFTRICTELNISSNIIPSVVRTAQIFEASYRVFEKHQAGYNSEKKIKNTLNKLKNLKLESVVNITIKVRSTKKKKAQSISLTDDLLIEELVNVTRDYSRKWINLKLDNSQQLLSKLTTIHCKNLESYLLDPRTKFCTPNNQPVEKETRYKFIGLIILHSNWPLYKNQRTKNSGVQRIRISADQPGYIRTLTDLVRLRIIRQIKKHTAHKNKTDKPIG